MGCCSKNSWNNLLAYETPKIVRIRNAKIGIIFYILVFIILLYIVGWTILYQKRYLRLESPVGTIRASLRKPCLKEEAYQCGNVKIPDDYVKNCTRSPADTLPYCKAFAPHYPDSDWENYNCEYWDEKFVHYPSMENSALFVTTRLRKEKMVLNCDITKHDCEFEYDSISEKSYIAEIERFTVQLDHTVYADWSGIQINAQDIEGVMYDCEGNVIKNTQYPNIIGQRDCRDTFEIKTLLDAACVPSLDSETILDGGKNITKRDSGMVLIAFVRYSNTKTFNLNKVSYSIKVATVKNTQYKADQTKFSDDLQEVVIMGRHGIRIVFLQVGEIGKFDFQELLLTFVSGFGLLAVATLIVDFLSTSVLSWKDFYGQAKYQETPMPDDIDEETSDETTSLIRSQITKGEGYDQYIYTS